MAGGIAPIVARQIERREVKRIFKCELCDTEFLTQTELDNHIHAAIERAHQKGGKFALLARILQGDESAVIELQELVDAGLIGPGFDRMLSKN